MTRRVILFALSIVPLLLSTGCDTYPARGGGSPEVIAPNQVVDFQALFAQNCAGCHGPNGKDGAAIALANPVFLAITNDATIRARVSAGMPKTPMSAFAQSAGGPLTNQQIEVLVHGIRSWAGSSAPGEANLPSHNPAARGDSERGAAVFRTYCSSCHGEDGKGGKAGSVVDGSYLALVSDEELRMNVILGRPAAGAPDWRNNIPGRPLAEQEISDVVAWLAAQRQQVPGQPYPTSATERPTGGNR